MAVKNSKKSDIKKQDNYVPLVIFETEEETKERLEKERKITEPLYKLLAKTDGDILILISTLYKTLEDLIEDGDPENFTQKEIIAITSRVLASSSNALMDTYKGNIDKIESDIAIKYTAWFGHYHTGEEKKEKFQNDVIKKMERRIPRYEPNVFINSKSLYNVLAEGIRKSGKYCNSIEEAEESIINLACEVLAFYYKFNMDSDELKNHIITTLKKTKNS